MNRDATPSPPAGEGVARELATAARSTRCQPSTRLLPESRHPMTQSAPEIRKAGSLSFAIKLVMLAMVMPKVLRYRMRARS